MSPMIRGLSGAVLLGTAVLGALFGRKALSTASAGRAARSNSRPRGKAEGAPKRGPL